MHGCTLNTLPLTTVADNTTTLLLLYMYMTLYYITIYGLVHECTVSMGVRHYSYRYIHTLHALKEVGPVEYSSYLDRHQVMKCRVYVYVCLLATLLRQGISQDDNQGKSCRSI